MSTPPRPDLMEQPSKPDVLVRLRDAIARGGKMALRIGVERGDLADAIAAIAALRETCERRLATIRDLQRELADLRQEEGR